MKRPMIKLRNWIWQAFAIFTIGILVALFLLQNLALKDLYYQQETERIEAMGERLAEQWRHVRFSQPVSIRFYEDEIPVRIFNMAGASQSTDVLDLFDPDPLEAVRFIKKYEASGKPVYTNIEREGSPESGFLIYGTKLLNEANPDSSLYLYIIDPIGPLDSVRLILKNQLLTMSILTIVLSLLLSYFIAYRIAKPMVDLTRQAQKLGAGDYSVHFQNDDVKEIHQLAESLNAATAELAKIDETKTNLLASVSHDLRTPLTMIKAYSEMIRDLSGDDPKRRQEHIGVILQETDWMSDLITDILEYSRIRSGNMNYEMRVFDLASLTDVCVERFRDIALQQDRGVTIDWENSGYVPVSGDVIRIQRVIDNLLSNALKHSPDDAAMEVSIEQTGSKVRWGVRDHGEGIAPENLDQIWDLYFTRSSMQNRVSGSTGLGLSIVRGILEDHRCDYGVNSTPGEGADFWFVMELARPDNAVDGEDAG